MGYGLRVLGGRAWLGRDMMLFVVWLYILAFSRFLFFCYGFGRRLLVHGLEAALIIWRNNHILWGARVGRRGDEGTVAAVRYIFCRGGERDGMARTGRLVGKVDGWMGRASMESRTYLSGEDE